LRQKEELVYLGVTVNGGFEILVTKSHVAFFPRIQHVLHLLCPNLKRKLQHAG
jgi:hypothetical protein